MIPKCCHAKKKLKIGARHFENEMATKMVMPTSVSFLEMPCEILCCLSIPPNTLRKTLEFFL